MSDSDPTADALAAVMEGYRQARANLNLPLDDAFLSSLKADLEKASGGKVRVCQAVGDEVMAEIIVLDKGYRVRLS